MIFIFNRKNHKYYNDLKKLYKINIDFILKINLGALGACHNPFLIFFFPSFIIFCVLSSASEGPARAQVIQDEMTKPKAKKLIHT